MNANHEGNPLTGMFDLTGSTAVVTGARRGIGFAMAEALAAAFASRGRDEWAALFEASEGCVTPVLSLTEAPLHPHNRARGTFAVRDGAMQPVPAPRFSGTPAEATPPMDEAVADILARWA